MAWAAAAQAGSSTMAAGSAIYNTQETNKANAGSQWQTNVANAAIAYEQMRFQERMANTAHQREVSDLKAAGLNPILSATKGSGAPSPAGASATMGAAHYENSAKEIFQGISGAIGGAVDVATKLEQAKLLATQSDSTAKDVERKGIDNAYQATILGQQIKKSGLDINFSEHSLGDRLRQSANETKRQELGLKQGLVDIHRGNQALKYDYMTDKLMDSLNLMPSTAKRQDKGHLSNIFYDIKDLSGLVTRKFLGK